MIEVIINSKIRFIRNIEIKEEITMFKQKSITDFRVTFRYSSYFHDIDYVNKKIFELMRAGIIKLSIDSNMNVYKLVNNELKITSLNLKTQYNSLSGSIDGLDERQLSVFSKFDMHYIIEIAGQICIRNNIVEESNYQAMYLMLSPLCVSKREHLIYPIIKIYDNTITIEYRMFPGKNNINLNSFLKLIRKVHCEKNQIMMEETLKNVLKLSSEKKIYDRLYDDMHLKVCKLNDEYSLLDLALDMIFYITSDVGCWIGRQTYAINGQGINENYVKSLLLNYTGKLEINSNIKIQNLREYEDYKYYSLPTGTTVVGNIKDCYPFCDTVDDEILHINVKYKYLEQKLNKQQSLDELYLIKKELLKLKIDYLYKYNTLYLSKKVIEMFWEELQFDKLIQTANELIELYMSKKQINDTKKQDALNTRLSIIAVLLSSSPIYEYIVKPILSKFTKIPFYSKITIIDTFLYSITVVIIMILILIINKNRNY